jgi:hypothetical protein
MTDTFETKTCSRCYGSGKYSYCQMYGDTCFKCHGKGKVYTARALKAYEWLCEQRKIDIGKLEVGMRVFVPGVGKFTIRTIAEDGSKYLKNGQWFPYLCIRGERLGYCGVVGQTTVQLIPPADVRASQLAQALEMQNAMAA